MKLFGHELQGFAKAVVVLAAIFLLASGMCGVQYFVAARSLDRLAAVLIPFAIVELAVMLLSALALVVVLFAWAGSAGYHSLRNAPKGGVQKLMDIEDEDKPREED